MTGRDHWPYPWPLAWHPTLGAPQDARPDPGLFRTPQCGGFKRTHYGLWASPSLGGGDPGLPQMSAWQIHHDKNRISIHDVRRGWLLEWPQPGRMATVNSFEDLRSLCEQFPCTAHRDFTQQWRYAQDDTRPEHDVLNSPPLDFTALSQRYDALYLTQEGIDATYLTSPGTMTWQCETVLWLRPVWQLIAEQAFPYCEVVKALLSASDESEDQEPC